PRTTLKSRICSGAELSGKPKGRPQAAHTSSGDRGSSLYAGSMKQQSGLSTDDLRWLVAGTLGVLRAVDGDARLDRRQQFGGISVVTDFDEEVASLYMRSGLDCESESTGIGERGAGDGS